MAGGQSIEAHPPGPLQKGTELDVPVALHTRVRRPSSDMSGHIGSDDMLVEDLGLGKDVMDDPQMVGDPAGVIHVGHRTASRVRPPPPQLEGDPDHVMAPGEEPGSSHRRVHPPGHGYQDAHRI
jgi:hypothetical protein